MDSVRVAGQCGIRISVAEYSPIPGTPLWPRCVASSRFPLEAEPLCHNNTVLPMEWEGLTRADLARIKQEARNLSAAAR